MCGLNGIVYMKETMGSTLPSSVRSSFLTALEVGKLKIKNAGRFSIWQKPGSIIAFFFLCSHMVEGTRDFFGIPFVRVLIPFTKTPLS